MQPEGSVPPALLTRRDALQFGAVGALALGGIGLARRTDAQPCTANPSQTEGPYWVDEMLSRSDIRSDPTTGALQSGLPLRLALNVSEVQAGACSPVAGAYVDIWHCNASGVYSDTNAAGNGNTLGQKWLRGYQVTDAHGNVRFLTIYPGWYQGRTVHIHFRVRRFSGATTTFNFVSQLYFNDALSNAIYARTAPYNTRLNRSPAANTADGIYNAAMLLRMADNANHAVASFNIVINSQVGLTTPPGVQVTPEDPEAMEHALDFGGGTPPLASV